MTGPRPQGCLAPGLALGGALALAGCAIISARPDERCARWRLVLEPRVTAMVGEDGSVKPMAALTARPVCVKPRTAS